MQLSSTASSSWRCQARLGDNAMQLNEETLELISKEEPQWLAKLRQQSFDLFKEMPLEKSELFKKYVNLELNLEEFILKKESAFPKNLEFLVGGASFIQPANNLVNSNLEEGVVLTDINSAVTENENLVKKYFDTPESKLAALNASFFNSGYFLYVPDNVELKMPIRVLTAVSGDGSAMLSRNLIVVGRNSTLKFAEELYSASGEKQSMSGSLTAVHLMEGAQANIGCIQNLGSSVIFTQNKKAVLEKDAHLTSSSGFFGGSATLSRFDSIMKDGASSEDFEIVFGSSSQRYDITSNIIHRGLNTNGKVVVKGIFDGSSSGVFKGMIDIDKNAKYANAYLAEHSMLLNNEAKSDAIPGLEIQNNEVKATHSASVAQINEEELFYLMARGLGREEAKKLIVLGFFEPLFRQMPFAQVRTVLKSLFEIKWEKLEMNQLKGVMERSAAEEMKEEITSKDIFERHYKYR